MIVLSKEQIAMLHKGYHRDKDPVDLPGEFQTGTAVDRWYRVTE